MLHSCVPQSMTPEALAKWIQENQIDTQIYVKKIPLDEETTHELEKQSALASRAIMRLDDLKKEITETLNEGTPCSIPEDSTEDPQHQPKDFTIPPTKGYKALKKNLEYANKQLEEGCKEEEIEVFMIPNPETSMVIGVDITGEEFFDENDRNYSRQMTDDEVNNIAPMLRVEKPTKKKKEKPEKMSFMEEGEPTLDL
jgi:hypothetical protein